MPRPMPWAALVAALLLSPQALAAPRPPDPATASAGFLPCADRLNTWGAAYAACLTQQADFIGEVRRRQAELERTSDTGGCIGRDEATCVAFMAQRLVVTSDPTDSAFAPQETRRDLDGVLQSRNRYFYIYVPGLQSRFPIQALHTAIAIAPDQTVSYASIDLQGPPSLTVTVADYDGLGIYDAAVALLGLKCIGEDRVAFYRTVRDMREGARQVDTGRRKDSTGTRAMCGVTFGVSESWPTLKNHDRHDQSFNASVFVMR